MAPLLQTRARTLAEAVGQVDFLFTDDPPVDEASWTKAMTQPWSAPLLDGVIAAYETAPWEVDAAERGVAAPSPSRSTSSCAWPRARCACP